MPAGSQKEDRLGRYRRGRISELMAAALLLGKGYRILVRRCRTPYGELDIVAVRGRRLAFVEVKRRATTLDGEAALSARQAGRIARAAEFWINRNPRFRNREISIDAMLVSPGRWPRHLPGALNITLPQRR